MQAYEIITKKRDGFELTDEEVKFIVDGFVSGEVADYQMSAFAMAVYFKGLNANELSALTTAMVNSGDTIDLSEVGGITADKHSSGGVGDKTTLVLAPMVAAAGLKVAKFSGRGLGFTGGTIDKLEAIPGFRTDLSREEFITQIREIGLAVSGASGDIDPADKKLYALRDVTGTVESIPLIASSIMSKKLAIKNDIIALDVKVGSGAFMKTIEEATILSKMMVGIGTDAGRNTVAVISSMEEPLGYAIGNAVEVIESLETLKGNGPEDLTSLCVELGANMLAQAMILSGEKDLADYEIALAESKHEMNRVISDGSAIDAFRKMIEMQGGDASFIDSSEKLSSHKYSMKVEADSTGNISSINAEEIGLAVKNLGGGREKKEDVIEPGVGVILRKKIGAKVEKGDILAEVLANDEEKGADAVSRISKAFVISDESVEIPSLVIAVITKRDL